MTRTLPLLVFVTACLPDFPKRDFTEDPTHDGDGDGVTELDGDCDDAEPLAYPGADEVCDGIDNDCDGDADEDDAIGAALWYGDNDRDGYGSEDYTVTACFQPDGYAAEPGDCDETIAGINPGAQETCSGYDDDCDGMVDDQDDSMTGIKTWYRNADGDAYGDDGQTVEGCEPPEGYVYDGGDCDDLDAAIYPGATEQCDERDNDCDGLTDDEDPDMVGEGTWYADTDGDGFGNPMSDTLEQCAQPDGHVLDATDCDDDNALANPAQLEACNGFDDDCNGETDEDLTIEAFIDADGDGFGAVDAEATDVCEIPEGHSAVATDCDDDNALANPDQIETCNEVDDDCDGVVDDGVKLDFFADSDADGFGDLSSPTEACAVPDGYTTDFTDCDDSNPLVNPEAAEQCATEGIDDNCDGRVDESDASDALTWHLDADGDGFGDADATLVQCTEPASYVADGTDCDDARATSHPDAVELCGTPTRDDDCDGDTNDDGAEGCSTYWYDGDDDGYGDALLSRCQCVSDEETGYISDRSDDCDDTQLAVHPERGEDCGTAADDNCNGDTNDEGAAGCVAYWRDVDEDGFGVEGDLVCVCTPFEPYDALAGGDCADLDGAVHPDADEVCFDEMDNDCDGLTDDSTSSDASVWYQDSDGDDHGVAELTETACAQPEGYTDTTGDCDDTRDSVNPDKRESCFTAFDDNCDGSDNDPGDTEDEGPIGGLEHFMDADGDGFGLSDDSVWSCDDADLYRTRITPDCDDDNSGANPATAETCATEFDDDCDGDDNDLGAVGCTTLFYDWDGDEYGIADSECRCISMGEYTAELAGDCVDTDADINPGTESCGLSGEITTDMANAVVSNRYGDITSAGDVNGDGYGDLRVDNYTFSLPTDDFVISNAGVVHIWYGPPPAAMDGSLITGVESADASIVGSAAQETVGHWGDSDRTGGRQFGELTGDGYGDLLVAYQTDLDTGSVKKNIALVAGPLEGVSIREEWETVFVDSSVWEHGFPDVVSDVTGDGSDDLFGDPDHNGTFHPSQRGFASLGEGDWTGHGGTDDFRYRSADWSGDGLVDVAYMDRRENHFYLYESNPGVGDEPPDDWEGLSATTYSSRFYLAPGGVNAHSINFFFGETNDDGHIDLVIVVGEARFYDPILGTQYSAGETYIIHGPLDAHFAIADHLSLGASTIIRGGMLDYLGYRSAFADFNGDGFDDVVLSRKNDSYLYYSPLPSGTLELADANGYFTSMVNVRSVGDLNNDGRADLVFLEGVGGVEGPAYIFYGQPTE